MENSTLSPVSFGTSGHRGIIGNSFNHDHVQAIAVGVASLFKTAKQPTIVIGFDPRKGNSINIEDNSFTKTLITTLNHYGVNTVSYNNYVPTPLISWAIRHYNYDGGLILTASHNPPEYNGIKFNPKNGAPAPKDVTNTIEKIANQYLENPTPLPNKTGQHQLNSAPLKEFSQSILSALKISGIPMPKSFSKSLFVDVKHGACGPVWQAIMQELNLDIHIDHKDPRSDFGNIEPNPTKYDQLKIGSSQVYFSAANDPDGDRHAVLDNKGSVVSPEEITVIIANYLTKKGISIDTIASTLASSHLIKEFCKSNSINYKETAVGFKYFSPFLEHAFKNNSLCLAVESSGGFSTSTHTFEKCGFLPIIALAAICENEQKTCHELKSEIYNYCPKLKFVETAIEFNPSKKQTISTFLSTTTLKTLQKKLNIEILAINQTDGLKIETPDGWVLCRLSGTEPIARLYAESHSSQSAKILLESVKNIF